MQEGQCQATSVDSENLRTANNTSVLPLESKRAGGRVGTVSHLPLHALKHSLAADRDAIEVVSKEVLLHTCGAATPNLKH